MNAANETEHPAADPIDELYFLTKLLVEENGLSGQDALILAKAKLDLPAASPQ